MSLERKVKEAIVTIQIEKRYTKREILALYVNQMYLGHGAYGVEAARVYFNKRARTCRSTKPRSSRGSCSSPRTRRRRTWSPCDATPDLRAPAHGGRGLHHAGGGRRREGEGHRGARPAGRRTRPRPTSSRRCGRTWSTPTGRRSCTRTASPSRRRSTSGCRTPRTRARRRAAAGGQATASASRRRNVADEGHALETFHGPAGIARWPPATSSRGSSPRS